MGSTALRVGIEPGDGLVARFGDIVILVAAGTAAEDAVVKDLLDALAAAAVQTPPGAAAAARLAGILSSRPAAEIPAFGVVAPVEDGFVILLRGAVTAEAVCQDGAHQLSGRQALTWLDRVIDTPVERIALTCSAGRSAAPHPWSDLREGVVPGQGFLVTVGSGAATTDGVQPSPGTSASPGRQEPVSTSEVHAGSAGAPASVGAVDDSAEGQPTDGQGRPGSTATAPSDAPSTKPPTSVAPSPSRAPANETMVARVPLGALVADAGGLRILLDRAYVIGRDPHNDPAVRRATASPIVVHDPDNLISRVHVYVSVDGGEVMLQDVESGTGTYIAAPGATDWIAVGAEPAPLPPGWSVRLGRRVFTFVAMGTPRQQS